MKVLVADDSQPIRDRLVDRLSRLTDIRVAEAVDTTEALERMATFKPDVAILDIRMPGGGGIKALTGIKKNFPGTTVIVMTNYPYAQYRRKCLDEGADFFFDKSSEFEQVAETICQLMQAVSVGEVARRTAAAQLVAAKEEIEKKEQRLRDMSILRLLPKKPDTVNNADQSYAMWEKTFDAIPDMVAIFDTDHCVVRVNKAMADQLGVPAAELTGKKCFEYIHGTTCPTAGCPHETMLKDGQEHSREIFSERANKWFNITVSPIRGQGRLIGAIHIAHDITVRRKAACELKASEMRYRQLFESMQSGFALHEIICDEKGVPCDYRFLEINPAFETLTGLKAEELIGRTVKELMPAKETRWIEIYGNVALTGEPVRIDDFAGALGRHYSVSAYSTAKGQFATVFNDITEQKNAETTVKRALEVAESANRTQTQFLANMSHELRTPLNAILGFTQILQLAKLDEEQLDYIKTIGESGAVMLALVTDILDFSRIEMGTADIKKEIFNIREAVGSNVALVSLSAEKKGLELTCVVDDTVPEQITGDSNRLQQVLRNLLNNAVEFTDKGFIRLTVGRKAIPDGRRFVEFSVKDSGEGMHDDTVKRIFKPFQQGDNSNTRQHNGAGLGLAISKSLVEMMGGTLRVESRKGEGSTFSFTILDQAAL